MRYHLFLWFFFGLFSLTLPAQEDIATADRYYQKGDSLLRNEIDYQASFDWLRKALDIYLPAYGESHQKVARTYNRMGVAQRYLFQLKNAVKSGEKAVAIFEGLNMSQHIDYGTAVGELAGTLSQLGNFEKAVIFYGKTMEVYLKKYGPDDPALAPLYYNIGNAHLGKENPDLAITYFEKALALDFQTGDDLYIADDYDNLGLAFQMKGDYEKALSYYEQALALYYPLVGEENEYTVHALKLKGECLLDMNRVDEAIGILETALAAGLVALGEKNKEIADLYAHLGSAYAKEGQLTKADSSFHAAFQALGYDPEQAFQFEEVSSLVNLAMVFNLQGQFLEQQWKNTPDPDFSSTINVYEQAAALIDTIRLGYREKGAKLDMAKNSAEIYEGGIRNLYQWYQKTDAPEALEKLVQFFEKDKSLLILESLIESEAQIFAGIPSSLLEQETQLEAKIAFLEEEKFAEQQYEDADPQLINELNSRIYEAKQAYYAFKTKLEQEYPQYYHLRYDLNVLSLEKLQTEVLGDQQTLIEFFAGDKNLYALIIQRNNCYIHQYNLNNQTLLPLVTDIRSGLYDYFLLDTEQQNKATYEQYHKLMNRSAAKLYELLISPLEDYRLTDRLTIVPDGVLGYIPFDVLLSEKIKDERDYREYPFLAKKYNISYSYSATLMSELQSRLYKNRKPELLAFAPVFEASETTLAGARSRKWDLGALKYNIPEVNAIAKIFPARVFTGKEATEENFREYAGQYSLIHLSTHGKANDKIGDYSFLAFSMIDDGEENEVLFVRDLYALNLKADLVVLSACETGIGELQEGEGIVSLASGFSYAGAKSILTTLWSVNDAQTKDIMTRFYRNLADGLPKDEAIFQAKLDYLTESRNDKAHPFYWAAYIPLGDMTVVQSGSFQKLLLWSILLLALSGLIIIFVLYRRNQSSSPDKLK